MNSEFHLVKESTLKSSKLNSVEEAELKTPSSSPPPQLRTARTMVTPSKFSLVKNKFKEDIDQLEEEDLEDDDENHLASFIKYN